MNLDASGRLALGRRGFFPRRGAQPMTREEWLRTYGGLHATNGYAEAPWPIYDQFLKVVDTPGPILEVACGNGLLLRYLTDLSGLALEPSGLDINAAAVAEAKAVVFPERAPCFVHADLRDGIPFGDRFATVLANPLYADPGYYAQVDGKIQRLHFDGGMEAYVGRCWDCVDRSGRLVLWIYDGHAIEIADGRDRFVAALESLGVPLRYLASGPVVFWISDRKAEG